MSARFHFQPLKPAQMKDFWLVNWVSIMVFAGVLVFAGQVTDWLRLTLFAIATLLAQRQVKKHPFSATFGFLLFTLIMHAWLYLDPNSLMQRTGQGVAMYALVATGSVFATSMYCGVLGAVIAVLWACLPFMGQPLQALIPMMQIFGGGAVGALMNNLVHHLEQTRDQLETAVMTDALTGLENRYALPIAFAQQLAHSVREGKPLLLTLWDLNNLKRINDTQGHNAGDTHLKNFAQVLKLETRQGDLFYRTGGDEFVGLHLGTTDGFALRDRVQGQFSEVAVGWSVVLEDLETTLHNADVMMYEAKKMQKLHSAK